MNHKTSEQARMEQARIEVYKYLQETQAKISAYMDELNKAGESTFDEWLACSQALMQIQQIALLQGIFDMLSNWYKNGVPVYPMAI